MSLKRPRQADMVERPVMNRFGTIRGRVLVLGAVAVLGGLLAGGCGYSEHDEYFRIRGIVIEPTPGDGSMIASLDHTGQVGNARAAVAMNRARGRASDQPVSRE